MQPVFKRGILAGIRGWKEGPCLEQTREQAKVLCAVPVPTGANFRAADGAGWAMLAGAPCSSIAISDGSVLPRHLMATR